MAVLVLPPGSVIGMLGGGQLARMAALAAAPLGYRIHIFTPHADDPALQVSAGSTVAAWDDEAALAGFAAAVDAVTLEFENVPVPTVEFLARFRPVFPSAQALAVAQDRVAEKSFLNRLGIETAAWAEIDGPDALAEARAKIGAPSILKTARLGYDGKGQVKVETPDALNAAWDSLDRAPSILEAQVALAMELSIVLARGQDGAIAAYAAVGNRHRNGILAETVAPARISRQRAAETESIACRVAEALNYVGVLAVEFFVTKDGALLVNEIAPRPHNSGHWTIDACHCSQFEQQIRAVAGLPLGPVTRHSDAVMTNLIGDAALDWETYVSDPTARLHLYGKTDIRPGRKMGHVTKLYPMGMIR